MSNEHGTLKRETFKVGQYIIDRKRIGKGASGVIYKGYHSETKKVAAIKEISVGNIHDISKNIKREIALMKKLDHPNIVKLYDVYLDGKYDNVYLFMEYCTRSDFYKFQNRKPIKELHVQQYMKQLMLGLKYLKKYNIMHRDLKPQNILITESGTLKLTDFGYAKITKPNDMVKTFCGSPLYMAPEIIKSKGTDKYTMKSDLWSVGCIFYEMITGVPPYHASNINDLIKKIEENDIIIPKMFNVSDEAKDLLFSLLEINPDDRITWDDFFNHKWFQKDLLVDEENKLLAFDIGSPEFTTELPSINEYQKNTKIFLSTHLTKSGIRPDKTRSIDNYIPKTGTKPIKINNVSKTDYILIGTPPKSDNDNDLKHMSQFIENTLENNIVSNRKLNDMYNDYNSKQNDNNDENDEPDELFFSCDSISNGQHLLNSIDNIFDEMESNQLLELSDTSSIYTSEQLDEPLPYHIHDKSIDRPNDSLTDSNDDKLLVEGSTYVSGHFTTESTEFNMAEFTTSLISTENSLTTEQSDPFVIIDYNLKPDNITHSDQREYKSKKHKLNKLIKSSFGFFKGSIDYIGSYSSNM